MDITVDLFSDIAYGSSSYQVLNLTTDYLLENSNVIFNNTWYYTRISVTLNSVISAISTESYDMNGGTIIQELTRFPSEPVMTFTSNLV